MTATIVHFRDMELNDKMGVLSANPDLHEDELTDGEFFFTEDLDRLYPFEELSNLAKQRARKLYARGWRKTHPEEKGIKFGDDIVGGDGAFLFDVDGTYIGEAP